MDRDTIRNQVLLSCPGLKFNNDIFLSEKAMRDFSIDEIAKLSMLSHSCAWTLWMYLYSHSIFKHHRAMIVNLCKADYKYFENDDDSIYVFYNILKKYEESNFDDISYEDYILFADDNKINNSGKDFLYYDISFYNYFFSAKKLYNDGKLSLTDLRNLICFLTDTIKKKFINYNGNYDSKYDNFFLEIVEHLMNDDISFIQFYDGINNNNIEFLYLCSKFNISRCSYKNIIPLEVLSYISSKRIRKIFEIFKNKDINLSFSDDDIKVILINMSILLGMENVDNIIRHLPLDKEKVKRLFVSFCNFDMSHIETDDGIRFKDGFIKFFMGDNLNEPNSLLNLIYDGKTMLSDKVQNIYYYWDNLNDRFLKQELKTRLAFFEELFLKSEVILNPDEFRLEGRIINTCIDNKKFQALSDLDQVERIRNVYSLMKYNFQKSIPYVSSSCLGYTYETLKANDPIIFNVGASTNCCFKIGGEADGLLNYCALNKNGRVLVVRDGNNNIVAMVPMFRNGNLILCNSVETKFFNDVEFKRIIFKVLEKVGEDLVNISSLYESDEKSIKGLVVGNYKNDIGALGKYEEVNRYISRYFLPIFSGNEFVYCNMGIDSHGFYEIFMDRDFEYTSKCLFAPDVIYNDPRKRVNGVEIDMLNDIQKERLKKIINSICYSSGMELINISDLLKVDFNDDWFIAIDKKYHIYSLIVGEDKRAYDEYDEFLLLEKEFCSFFDEDGNFKERARYM